MTGSNSSRFALRLQGAVALLLFLAVIGLLGYLAHTYDRRFDWTATGRNSLSDASRQVLEKLPEPVTATVFARPNPELRASLDDLLRRYAAASPKFTVSFVNPDQAPARVKELGIRADGTVLLELAGRREKLEQLDEQALTSALMRLSRSGERRLIFLAGHGERSPDGQANHDLSTFTTALREQGVLATRPDPAGGKDFPTDATLVITAPAVDLTGDEVGAIQRFLTAGGNLLWLADPGPLHGLEPIAAELGLRFVPGTLIDPVGQAIAGSAHFAIATADNYRFHAALAGFEFMTLFPLAAGLEHDPKEPWAATDLIELGASGWAETGPLTEKVSFDEGLDRRGPFILAAAFTRKLGEREQRVVVVGDGDFLSNSYVGNGGNLNLGLNLVNWLAADEGLVSIPPRTAPDTELSLSRDNSLLIGFGFLFGLPAAFAAAGLGVWLRRRGR
ncbi:MAG: GldG family protein [Immundisolibacter sp.]|uniref:GldG family protein n=1 Tax=Immundisolibacter sp. TaxID=1934948 RepID=UPI001998D3EE|nr:GldG family protein [Immundisolibacter sp.]MBC7160982.1 GldG family protein [Immundisolibacter sp.]